MIKPNLQKCNRVIYRRNRGDGCAFFLLKIKMMKISSYNNAKDPNPTGSMMFEQYLLDIKEGKWQDIVLPVRALKARYLRGEVPKDEYTNLKLLAPAVTASGTFTYRAKDKLEAHSGIIAMDFDEGDNPDGTPFDQLAADPYTLAIHRSIGGGDGVAVYVKIDAAKHLEAFLGLEKYYADNYHIIADKTCKDVNRLRFVSFDPDLYHNPKSQTFKRYLPKAVAKERTTQAPFICGKNDVELVLEQLNAKGANIAESYDDWIRLAFAFASEYGEGGRQYFHEVSRMSAKYDSIKTDKKYNNALKSSTKVNIGSFFFMAKQAGVEKLKTDETIMVETIAKNNKLKIGKAGYFRDEAQANESTIKELQLKGIAIDADVITEVMDKVNSTSIQDIKKGQLTGDAFEDSIRFVKSLPLRFNEITRCIETEGRDINDKDYNTFYIQAKRILGKGVTKTDIVSIIESDEIEGYHPFAEFLNKISSITNKIGFVADVLNCFELDSSLDKDYNQKIKQYILKWMVSVVASMHGTYSIMCLVLCGAQGKGKTEFFRGLLPNELKKYYAESKLDAGKDDEILMTKKLIILDDEFGGKSKQDAKKFKDLIGKQTFTLRRPYGRVTEDLPRLAVLCGTSNEEEVLNDPTGNRRIIPVNLKNFNISKFKSIDKNGLWAELYDIYQEVDDTWMLSAEDIQDLERLASKNKQACQEEEAFLSFFAIPEDGQKGEFLTNTEIKTTIEMNTRLKISHVKLAAVLKALGLKKQAKKINGVSQIVYEVLNLQPSNSMGAGF